MKDERIMFDYALYRGKYYVYFGVLPCILFYLPFRLLFHADMPDAIAELLLLAAIIPAIYLLLKEIIRRYYPYVSFGLHFLVTIGIVSGSMIIPLIVEPLVYHVAIISGVCFTMWGVLFWLWAFPNNAESMDINVKLGNLLAGSVCMALVLACRPTMIPFSGMIIPIVLSYRKRVKTTYGDKVVGLINIKILISVIFPYIAIGLGLMYYNQIRFDNPLQFGMIYNMTIVPSRKTAVDILELIPITIYEYLLKPPSIEHLFPFIKENFNGNVKELSGTIYYYETTGVGIFTLNPLLAIIPISVFFGKNGDRGNRKRILKVTMMIAILLTIVMMLFGVFMTQVVATRYIQEFVYVYLFAAAFIVFGLWMKISNTEYSASAKTILVFLIIIPVGFNFLFMFISKAYPLNYGNTELYYRVFNAFHFL